MNTYPGSCFWVKADGYDKENDAAAETTEMVLVILLSSSPCANVYILPHILIALLVDSQLFEVGIFISVWSVNGGA